MTKTNEPSRLQQQIKYDLVAYVGLATSKSRYMKADVRDRSSPVFTPVTFMYQTRVPQTRFLRQSHGGLSITNAYTRHRGKVVQSNSIKIYWSEIYQVKESDGGRACNTHGQVRNNYKISVGKSWKEQPEVLQRSIHGNIKFWQVETDCVDMKPIQVARGTIWWLTFANNVRNPQVT
jgi:hypothetical protein